MSKTQGRQHQRSSGVHNPQLFCVAKRKRGNNGEKRKSFQAETLKGCHEGKNITALAILERLEFKIFSFRPAMMADNTFQDYMATLKSILPTLKQKT